MRCLIFKRAWPLSLYIYMYKIYICIYIIYTLHIYYTYIYIYIYYICILYLYTINLSRHEQVCLMRLFWEILLPSLGLIKHVHGVINVLYYEHWTDKWNYIPCISVKHKVLKSCRSMMATWGHDVWESYFIFVCV